jgi:L-seryl-tRNA(Ser) seleniumtransferase
MMVTMDPRRRIPRTDAVLDDPRVVEAARGVGRTTVKTIVAAAQQRARSGEITPDEVVTVTVSALATRGLRPVINATGVLVHTNLGRAPLSRAAADAVLAACGATDVEFDLATGERARRGRTALAALAAAVPGAQDVHVVNNNAAALVLAATALAAGREIIISRGEMVEIGDGFRLPDLLQSTGARLREVGTTNRTTMSDYAEAIGADTGFILKVHPSNFRVEGFTAAASVTELAALPAPVVVDIGSGLFAPEPLLPDEPDAATALRAGGALVTASGDKLLGGPQAGIILGRGDLVTLLRRHPLARALRVDKLTLAALEATVRDDAPPVPRALRADVESLRSRAERIAGRIAARLAPAGAEVVDSAAAVGGGGAPGHELPSVALALPESLAVPLRQGRPAVVGRVVRGRLLLDLRSVDPGQDDALAAAVLACM